MGDKNQKEEDQIISVFLCSMACGIDESSEKERREFFQSISAPHKYFSYVPNHASREFVLNVLSGVSIAIYYRLEESPLNYSASSSPELAKFFDNACIVELQKQLEECFSGMSAIDAFELHVGFLKNISRSRIAFEPREDIVACVKGSAVNLFVSASMDEISDLLIYAYSNRLYLTTTPHIPEDLMMLTITRAGISPISKAISPVSWSFLENQFFSRICRFLNSDEPEALVSSMESLQLEKIESLISEMRFRVKQEKLPLRMCTLL